MMEKRNGEPTALAAGIGGRQREARGEQLRLTRYASPVADDPASCLGLRSPLPIQLAFLKAPQRP